MDTDQAKNVPRAVAALNPPAAVLACCMAAALPTMRPLVDPGGIRQGVSYVDSYIVSHSLMSAPGRAAAVRQYLVRVCVACRRVGAARRPRRPALRRRRVHGPPPASRLALLLLPRARR